MSDFSYSFNLGSTPNSQPASDETWSFCGVKILPGPGNTVLLHKVRTGQRMMVQPDLAQALQQCTAFRTLEAHAQRIMQAIPALKEHAQSVSETLETVRSKGLLESSRETWGRLTHASDTGTATPAPCRLFVLTCDRPDALRRLLDSLQRSPLPTAIEGIWVIDDSRQEDAVAENADIIASAQASIDRPFTHFDLNARETLIAALEKYHPQSNGAIRFLLDRGYWQGTATYGLARNLALLLSGGYRAVMMDDDIVLRAMQPPLQKRPLRFGRPNEREAAFFDSIEALEQHDLPDESIEPLSDVLGSLGTTLGAELGDHWSGPQELANVDGHAINRFSAQSRVLLTQCGYWGDTGSAAGNWVFHTPATTQKRLLGVSEDVEATLGSGGNWYGYRGPTLTSYGVMSALTGVDHTTLLPPYFPAGRNEDIVFGIMAQRLYPDSVVMNAGWAVPHHPIESRTDRGQLTAIGSGVDISLLADWIGQEPEDQWGLPASQQLAGLADQIERLAVMGSREMEQMVSHMLLSKQSGLLNRCLEQLAGLNAAGLDGQPGTERWREFLDASRERLLTGVQATDATPLADTLTRHNQTSTNDNGMGASIERLREMGLDFAAALRVWPALVQTASTLFKP